MCVFAPRCRCFRARSCWAKPTCFAAVHCSGWIRQTRPPLGRWPRGASARPGAARSSGRGAVMAAKTAEVAAVAAAAAAAVAKEEEEATAGAAVVAAASARAGARQLGLPCPNVSNGPTQCLNSTGAASECLSQWRSAFRVQGFAVSSGIGFHKSTRISKNFSPSFCAYGERSTVQSMNN